MTTLLRPTPSEFDVPKIEPGATLAGLGAESSTAVSVG
jgi:hypothetical protein